MYGEEYKIVDIEPRNVVEGATVVCLDGELRTVGKIRHERFTDTYNIAGDVYRNTHKVKVALVRKYASGNFMGWHQK